MSRPGELTDQELTDVGDGFRLNKVTAPWWFKAHDELQNAFGFPPILTQEDVNGRHYKSGGYRTRAEQVAINPGTSPDSSNHCKGRSVDITNQRSFRNKDEGLFIQIMRNNGWVFDASGEPWHATEQNTTTPAGGGGTPIGDFLMALSDGQQQQIFDALVQQTDGGGAYYKTDAIIGVLRGEVIPHFQSGAGYDWLLAIANQNNAAAVKIDLLLNKAGLSDADRAGIAKSIAVSLPSAADIAAAVKGTLADDFAKLESGDTSAIVARLNALPAETLAALKAKL